MTQRSPSRPKGRSDDGDSGAALVQAGAAPIYSKGGQVAEVTMLRRFTITPEAGGSLAIEERAGHKRVAIAISAQSSPANAVVELTYDEWKTLGEMVAAADATSTYSPGYGTGPTVLRDASEDETLHDAEKETSDDPGF